ncbi:toprim domain-containing protein [Trichocoleus sp. FACHB-591]|uniref:DUF3991 and TOPRIM domain-containing protein n=1 Tax=Trichocoleus sp. FACHB-591 TaxID=2692872 RepID=UPI001682AD90|nr:DUF3991 and TOPRIM domain-containing protein [Trichocoleus sp. FACHB-591]MBD2098862.1 toprim domain-containing protein [Trichocoleus sp. FACHB-591]
MSQVPPDPESAAQLNPDDQTVSSDLDGPSAQSEFLRSKFEVTDWVAIANEVRHFDLEAVANHLGLVKDRHDKNKWKGAGHIISINHDKFYDWLADRGSKGAIDLVMLVQNCDFKAAVHWLSGQSLTAANDSQFQIPVRSKSRPLELPQVDERHWEDVQRYLVEMRGLPAKLIHRLHAQGLVYADEHWNAVFLRYASDADGQTWARHQPTGALLRGTRDPAHPFHRLAPGSSRDHGWFWIAMGHGVVQRVLLTESPIDALSLATLETDKRSQIPGITIYLSTDGAGAIPLKPLQTVIEQGGEVTAVFDADHAGEKMAWRVAQQLRGVRRMAPAYGKDWNDRLLGEQQPQDRKPAVSARGDKQTLHSLWQWYRVASELGHSQNYLTRISEVARDVVEDHPLSQKARSAMRQDFQTYQRRIVLELQSGERTSAPDTSLRAPAKKQRLEVEVGS